MLSNFRSIPCTHDSAPYTRYGIGQVVIPCDNQRQLTVQSTVRGIKYPGNCFERKVEIQTG